MTLIDRHPDHGFIWLSITLLYILALLTIVTAASHDADFEKRIKALEEHSQALTRAVALDAEVKDIHQKVKVLEAQCGTQK